VLLRQNLHEGSTTAAPQQHLRYKHLLLLLLLQ
jgi:hypothetical protein